MEMKQWRPALLAGAGASMAIALLGWLDLSWQLTLLMAPFGASCVLLFSLPQSPLARPQNVLGGHLLSATLGLLVQLLPLPMELKLALGVGLSVAMMQGLGLMGQSTAGVAYGTILAFPLANSSARRLAADHGESLRQAPANVTAHTHINNEGAKAPSLFLPHDCSGLFGDLRDPGQAHLDPAIRGQTGDHLRLGAVRAAAPRHR